MHLNTYNNYNISEDWGWYVDTENNLFINSHKPYKKEEKDEYDYYKYNYIDIEEQELNSMYKEREVNQKCEKETGQSFLYKIGSTTLITAILTYTIFFLI